jgi:hypothetical protein
MVKMLRDFLLIGLFTPVLYFLYFILCVLFTFLFALPFVFAFRLVNMAVDILFSALT